MFHVHVVHIDRKWPHFRGRIKQLFTKFDEFEKRKFRLTLLSLRSVGKCSFLGHKKLPVAEQKLSAWIRKAQVYGSAYF